MPKMEPKAVQKDLEKGMVSNLYWLFGPERMKARELTQRIIRRVLGDAKGELNETLNVEKCDGAECTAAEVLDRAQGMSLFGGKRVVWVRNAEALKGLDDWMNLDCVVRPVDEVDSVLILWSKGFDGRKKIFKHLQNKAVVVECTEVSEWEREAWIEYLAKRKKVTLTPDEVLILRSCDPWNLEIIDQEIEKMSLIEANDPLRGQIISGVGDLQLRDRLLEGILLRQPEVVLDLSSRIADQPEFTLPFVGLLGWNVRQLQNWKLNPGVRPAPYLARNLERWGPLWPQKDLTQLAHTLFRMDLAMKSTRLPPLGLWGELAFCVSRDPALNRSSGVTSQKGDRR